MKYLQKSFRTKIKKKLFPPITLSSLLKLIKKKKLTHQIKFFFLSGIFYEDFNNPKNYVLEFSMNFFNDCTVDTE